MSGKVYFISGANRGIGFEFVKQLALDPSNTVIGTARNPAAATDLQELVKSNANVHVVKLDVSDEKSFEQLDDQLKDIVKDSIDVLISNAGSVQSNGPLLKISKANVFNHLNVNSVGPILLVQTLYKYLQKSQTKHLIFISALAGSLTGSVPAAFSSYGISKAALNYAVKEFSFELEPNSFTSIALHPGIVSTDSGDTFIHLFTETNPAFKDLDKSFKILTPAESVEKQLKFIETLSNEHNGKFFDENGNEVPF